MLTFLTEMSLKYLRIPYAMRRVPLEKIATLLPIAKTPNAGDIALVRLEKIGKNARLELPNGRPCNLHEGDLLAVVFGNRYATNQYEGYARRNGDQIDLMSMGGLCGLVEYKYDTVTGPSKLRLLGMIGDADGNALNTRQFALAPIACRQRPRVIVVCGTAMDSGKPHTAMSLVAGMRRQEQRVAAIKLTGTASGRDTWQVLDAGAEPALDFIDGGYASTYLCTLDELLALYELLIAHASAAEAAWVVIEIADGLLQQETAALLSAPQFTATVDTWVFATSDPVAAMGGINALRRWGIDPVAISGLISMSPPAMREAQAATGVTCYTAKELQRGKLYLRLRDAIPAAVYAV